MKQLLAIAVCSALAAQTTWIPGTNVGVEMLGLTHADLTIVQARPALVLIWNCTIPGSNTLRQSPERPPHDITIHEAHALDTRQCVRERGQPFWLDAGGDIIHSIGYLPPVTGYMRQRWTYDFRLDVPRSIFDLLWRPVYTDGWPPIEPCQHLIRPEWVALVISWSPR